MSISASNSRRSSAVWVVSRCAWTLYNFRLGLLKASQATGLRVCALGVGGDGFEARLGDAGIDFQTIPVSKKGLNPIIDLYLLWILFWRLRRERPALIHLFTIKPVIYGGLAARLARVRAVATVTGLGYVFTSGPLWLQRIVEVQYRMALRGMQAVFFQNAEDRELFIERELVCPERARLVAGSGVDTSRFHPPDDRDEGPLTFLMCARLIREKGVLEYLQAAARLRTRHPAIRFLLLGAPDRRNPTALSMSEVKYAAQEANAEWLGAVDDVRTWLARADVVVLPSYREGTPRSLLEAAAMGRALITTAATGCSEVVDEGVNGLLVPVRDVDSLAAAMERFVSDPGLARRFGKAGREKMLREFDERRVIERTFAAYREAGLLLDKSI